MAFTQSWKDIRKYGINKTRVGHSSRQPMKLQAIFLPALALLSMTYGQGHITKQISQQDVDQLVTLPPLKALLRFEGIRHDYRLSMEQDEETIMGLAEKLLSHPSLEQEVKEFFKLIEHEPGKMNSTYWIWRNLAYLREPWVVEVLASELMENPQIDYSNMSDEEFAARIVNHMGVGYNTAHRAIDTLHQFKLPYAPQLPQKQRQRHIEKNVEEWQQWWVTYGDQVIEKLELEKLERTAARDKELQSARADATRQILADERVSELQVAKENNDDKRNFRNTANSLALIVLGIALTVYAFWRFSKRP